MKGTPAHGFEWLPESQRAWMIDHRPVLEAIIEAFEREGEWPDPVALERRLRSQGIKIGVVRAVATMPRTVGWREYSPPRVVLTIFGLACAPGAATLLDQVVSTLRLALKRFDDPAAPRTLGRTDVQRHLRLNDAEMDRLSVVLLGPGNFFLGGGDAGVRSWNLEIDERVVIYEHVDSAPALISELASQRLVAPPVALAERQDAAPGLAEPAPPAAHSVVIAALAVLGISCNILTFLLAPPALAVAVVAATVTAGALHRSLTTSPPSLLAIAAVGLVGVLAAGATWLLEEHVVTHGETRRMSATEVAREQLALMESSAQKDHRRIVFRATAPLHGRGQPASVLVVLRDDRIPDQPPGDIITDSRGRFVTPRSDEVRIYDVTNRGLVLAFRFLPQGPGQIIQRPEGDHPGFRFRALTPVDVDGDGRREVVGAFERETLATGPLPVPVMVSWDAAAEQYRLAPLIGRPPALQARDKAARAESEAYEKPTVIADRYSGDVLRGHAVAGYTIVPGRPDGILVASFGLPSAVASGAGDQVQAWSLDLQGGALESTSCFGDTMQRRASTPLGSADDLARWFAQHAPPWCRP